jgi:hypothetical protein
MQRRVAALYFAFFVLIGAGAFGFVQVGMSQPTVSLDGPTLAQNDTMTVGERTYTLATVGPDDAGDPVGELTWTNESAQATATLANGSTTLYRGEEFRVAVENGSDGASLRLIEVQNASALLAADPAVEDTPVTQGGVEYVLYADNQTRGPPVVEYLPAPETVAFAAGDQLQYQADSGTVTADVQDVRASGATLTWSTTVTNTVELAEGSNVTLNGATHLVHFPDNESVQVLPADRYYGAYQSELAAVEAFDERQNGVWGVFIVCVVAAIVLITAAYLPVKG